VIPHRRGKIVKGSRSLGARKIRTHGAANTEDRVTFRTTLVAKDPRTDERVLRRAKERLSQTRPAIPWENSREQNNYSSGLSHHDATSQSATMARDFETVDKESPIFSQVTASRISAQRRI
jgi:hypothetical protein